ncbi:MAG: chemotaxis response regulator protein-glutamate methylesterase [Lachnospiraceae bacterium]|nr:chemotaxis response regulator protein-glutamate methylesterase [Lachnospiraceae bacterium]
MKKTTVLVVEDSKFFQQILVGGINMDPELEVVATAMDPFEARDAIVEYQPDVMTLDVELPRMNGIEFLKRLLPQYSMPVVVVSAMNSAVFDALAAGAVDFVNKPALGSPPEDVLKFVTGELCTKIKIASLARLGKAWADHTLGRDMILAKKATPANAGNRLIAIGASTGGTEAIFSVVKHFDAGIPGTVVVQHMPPGFTAMYAERLNNNCEVEVREARDGDEVRTGRVLIANGSKHMRLVKQGSGYVVSCRTEPKVNGHCPSVDVLFDSVAKEAGDRAIGVLLTGMGADGANGLLAMRKAGAETIGQDEDSCVVYGMPKVAYDIGAVKYKLGLSVIPSKIYQLLEGRSGNF